MNELLKKKVIIGITILSVAIAIIVSAVVDIKEYPNGSSDVIVGYEDTEQNPNVEIAENTTVEVPETTTVDLVESVNAIVICEGDDKKGIIYKLVGTQEETYNSVKIKVGVIKNNEWLVPLSEDSPFISEEKNFLIGGETLSKDWYYSNKYKYVARGCFACDSQNNTIVYNAETNQHYYLHEEDKKCSLHVFFVDDNSYADSNIIIVSRSYHDFDKISALDIDTMKEKIIIEECTYGVVGPYSNGLFAVGFRYRNDILYFYDAEGNKVLDVTKYGLDGSGYDSNYETAYFQNGIFSFTQTNSANTKYNLAINTKGEIILNEIAKQEKY